MKISNTDVVHSDVRFWLSLIRDRRWSRKQKNRLLAFFGGPLNVLRATDGERHAVVGKPRDTPLVRGQDLNRDLQWLSGDRCEFVHRLDSRFPRLLREISDPPLGFFAIGNLDLLDGPCVAIVGSRNPTPVGVRAASDISSELAVAGVSVVSGLALGIDGVAHAAALSSCGPTIAVLGAGLDIIYPNQNKGLFEKVADKGLVLSEYPLGFRPTKYSFPDRNRLVSGLSEGVVIVEAARRSGTLITAEHAVDQNREVLVVPGPAVSAQYMGSHKLLREGASLVCSGDQVLEQLSTELSSYCFSRSVVKKKVHSSTQSLTKAEATVMGVLDYESVGVDSIVEKTSLTAAEVSAILLELELNGCVAKTIEGGYIKTI